GADVIGMTNLPEARLAREAELPYCTLAMATDYDCWHDAHDAVTVEAIVAVMNRNVEVAKRILAVLAATIPDPARSPATQALAGAIISDLGTLDSDARSRLEPLLGRYLPRP
ncbi:MAG: S-methyl-5'-thioadenosine phosphorylase, partial [Polyangiaceae bacterium]|nr:S-methyl-5'-thioadenosine phosphorylase [Polyangiaceae bacterium]